MDWRPRLQYVWYDRGADKSSAPPGRKKLQRQKILMFIKRKAKWIGHILRRNCLLQQVIEGKIKGEMEVTRRQEEDVGGYWMTLSTGEDTLI
jgi:hypothetical protein